MVLNQLFKELHKLWGVHTIPCQKPDSSKGLVVRTSATITFLRTHRLNSPVPCLGIFLVGLVSEARGEKPGRKFWDVPETTPLNFLTRLAYTPFINVSIPHVSGAE